MLAPKDVCCCVVIHGGAGGIELHFCKVHLMTMTVNPLNKPHPEVWYDIHVVGPLIDSCFDDSYDSFDVLRYIYLFCVSCDML